MAFHPPLRCAGQRASRGAVLVMLGGALLLGPLGAQSTPDYEQAPVRYSATAPKDAMARLQARLESGAFVLPGEEREALQALLRELDIPVASQLAVFSKTSLQRGRIRPERPRVLYFSDTAYVGWVPGGLLEITTIDPELGPVFCSLELPRRRGGAPVLTRDGDCLRCHGGNFVRDIPGVFARSVFPSSTGEPLLRFGSDVVDDRTPFEKRWGGWYVTGYTGEVPHRGNAFAAEDGGELAFTASPARPAELSRFFQTNDYLAATSDVVALLVFEHQTTVQNALTKGAFSTRKMIAYQRSLQTHFKEPVTDEPVYDSVKSVMASAVENILDALLFREAAPLPAGVEGHAEFRTEFLRRAPRDEAGNSLKDFQLTDRLFRNRCSYLIYSEMFTALPDTLRARIWTRLRQVLDGADPSGRYAYLDTAERQRIRQVLQATHPDARAHWHD